MIKAVFFDLDGTLLPFERHAFESMYFHMIQQEFKDHPDAMRVVKSIAGSVVAMTKNTSDKTNEEVFIDYFVKLNSDHPYEYYMDKFMNMYSTEFQNIKTICDYEPLAKELVRLVKDSGLMAICATNPLFPRIATESRIQWAGLSYDDFDHVTTYENSVSAKPNPYYFEKLLEQFNLKSDEVILIGNDCVEDGAALKLGINVLLVDRCIENKELLETMPFHGSMDQVMDKLKELIA